MGGWLKSSGEERGRGRRRLTTSTVIGGSRGHVRASRLASSPDPDSLGSKVVDLTLPPRSQPPSFLPSSPLPGGCSLGLGCNLGFIRQKAAAQAALCFIIPQSSVLTAQCPDETHQHSILLTPLHPIINTSNSQTGLFKPVKNH